MNRRKVIRLMGGVAAWPFAARAQHKPGSIVRIGIIDNSSAWNPFRDQLRELNYAEGQNLVFEYREAAGLPDRLTGAATSLAQMPVNLIAVFGTPAAQAAKKATRTIPIVAISIGDPVRAGLVANTARPEGNITGNVILGPDVVSKRLQIIKDAMPTVRRVGFLYNPNNASNLAILDQLHSVIAAFELTLLPLPAETPEDLQSALTRFPGDAPEAVLTTNDPLHQAHMREVITTLLRRRIPTVGQIRQNAIDGGLMSYGASFTTLFRQGAVYADKILRGTKPEDLPFEQPIKFDLTINLKTAKALGLQLPETFLSLADEVIE